MIQGAIVIVICVVSGFRVQTWTSVPLALVFMALIAIMFTALGTAIGSKLADFQGFQQFLKIQRVSSRFQLLL